MKLFALLVAGSYAQNLAEDQYQADYVDQYDAYASTEYDSYDSSYDGYDQAYDGPGADDNRKGGNRNKNKNNKNKNKQAAGYNDGYQAPVDTYVPPADTYVTPAETYVAPAETYVAPAETYVAPVENYQAPASNYQAPAEPYKQPATNYQAPADNYQAPAYGGYSGISCWSCHATSFGDCEKNGYSKTCNSGDVCFLEIRERREGRVFKQISMGCHQEMACENNKAQNFREENPDHTQCKPEAKYNQSVCRQCCKENNCTKDPSWWYPTSREEWAYGDDTYNANNNVYTDNNNYQAPVAQESTYTAPAYKK